MPNFSNWLCEGCAARLGFVRRGVLTILVLGATVDPNGVTRVPCRTCGDGRTWKANAQRSPAGGIASRSSPPLALSSTNRGR